MPRGENRPSVLLSRDENDQVFSLIGPKCQSLATAVVQLFTTEGPAHSEWKKKDTGVLCLIKDNSKRSYFFRIYCLYRKALVWEHEVYLQIEYKSPKPYLHTFEAEDYMAAFNFANEDEARVLRNILIEKIELRKHRREERRQRSMLAARANSISSHSVSSHSSIKSGNTNRVNGVSPAPLSPLPPAPVTPAPMPTPAMNLQSSNKANTLSNFSLKGTGKKPKPKSRKLTKADIGMPLDFKHISHVGWDADKGFDIFDVDKLPEEQMRSFWNKAGITENQLKDQATRQFIYDFIIKNGGVEAVKEELHDTKPNESPRGPAPPPAPPVPARAPHPPAPPSRAPPPPPARAVPPPPPPAALTAPPTPRNPPPPRPLQPPPAAAPPSVPPPPPPAAAPPPPPPPPPPLAASAPAPPAPPPPPPPVDEGAVPDARAALMESIRNGNKTLKHVDVGSKNSLNDDSRNNLLSEIRQGINLRAVRRSSSSAGDSEELANRAAVCGLAGALAKALQERARAIQSSSESDDSENEASDFEWDD